MPLLIIILFGITHLSQINLTPSVLDRPKLGSLSTGACQTQGQAFECSPPFENIAKGFQFEASSTCGKQKTQRLCNSRGVCQLCNSDVTNLNFGPNKLTDFNDHQSTKTNQTCWASSFIRQGQNVNLTLSLGKKFEVHYISLNPCPHMGTLPDSIAIYKSMDYGKTWQPWHYFSTDCLRAFGLAPFDEYNMKATFVRLDEVLCVVLKPRELYASRFARSNEFVKTMNQSRPSQYVNPLSNVGTIAFSTTLGRLDMRPWSLSFVDWMTMTDLKVSLMRFDDGKSSFRTKRDWHNTRYLVPNLWINNDNNNNNNNYYPRQSHRPGRRQLRDSLQSNGSSWMGSGVVDEPDVLNEFEFYAFADVTIGGRCRCNGHASRCVFDSSGKLTCDCQHNTMGADCDQCKAGFMDKPWDRATAHDPHICERCDCNLHSNECRFSNSLYLLSNRVSGGVCEKCQHNTMGRNCHQCSGGFYRDWTKPTSHEDVCFPCRCHPIGSLVRHDCDRRSGQCRCKEGVAGLTCDRCLEGYHQSRSRINPCAKNFNSRVVALAHTPVDMHCDVCSTNKERIKLKKFCRKFAVIEVILTSRELHGNMARFEMQINHVWKVNHELLRGSAAIYWPLLKSPNQNDANTTFVVPVWVKLNDLRCKCPDIELGKPYLIVTDFESYTNKNQLELMLTTRSAVLPWRRIWKRRLGRFRRRELQGICKKYREPTKLLNVYRPKQLRSTQHQQHRPYANWHRPSNRFDVYSKQHVTRSIYPLATRPYAFYRNPYSNIR